MNAFKTLALGATLAASVVAGAAAASAQGVAYRPLTVAPQHRMAAPGTYYAPVAPAYDPYHGSAAVVTGPVHVAGTIATAPFRAMNRLFPAQGNTPLVLVGAPIYFVGKLVEFPFRVAEAPFGGPNPFQY